MTKHKEWRVSGVKKNDGSSWHGSWHTWQPDDIQLRELRRRSDNVVVEERTVWTTAPKRTNL